MTYYVNIEDATEKEIKEAFDSGMARIVYSYNPYGGLHHRLSLDGKDFDTRGQNYMMSEDSWTATPETLNECLKAAGL